MQFFTVTEVENSDKTFISLLAEDAENAVIMNIVSIYIAVFVKNRFLAADLLHAVQSLEDLALNRSFDFRFSRDPTGKHRGGYNGNPLLYPDHLYRNNH